MLKLVMWNTQGAKWDAYWTNYIQPLLAAGFTDVAGLAVESGWAPWVASGNVSLNAAYGVDTGTTWFNPVAAAASAFVQGIQAQRRRFALWIPWATSPDKFKTNTRCSLGGGVCLGTYKLYGMTTFNADWCKRPILNLTLTKGSSVALSIYTVHLVSGYWRGAQAELDGIILAMSQMIPTGTAAMIVGDMNIDLLNINLTVPKYWSILQTGVATQQSGGELDWALLYDPAQQLVNSSVVVTQQFKTGNNASDHSVLTYSIPL